MTYDPKNDLYALFGLRPDAKPEEIKAARNELIRKVHPDLNNGRQDATRAAQHVNEAYAVLTETQRRADYDRARRTYYRDTLKAFLRGLKTSPRSTPTKPREPGQSTWSPASPRRFGARAASVVSQGTRGPFARIALSLVKGMVREQPAAAFFMMFAGVALDAWLASKK